MDVAHRPVGSNRATDPEEGGAAVRVPASAEGAAPKSKGLSDGPLGTCMPENWVTVSYIALWYCASIGLVLYNKWMFGTKGLAFPFPITVTAFHMLTNSFLAWCLLKYKDVELYTSSENFEWYDFAIMMAPVAIFTGLDISLSNTAFMYLDATFVEMVKPSSILWILLFSFVLGIRRPTVLLGACVVLMFGGQVVISAHATSWDTKGFVIVVSAAVMAAMRSVLMQMMLHGHKLRRRLLAAEVMLYAMPGAGAVLVFASIVPYKECRRVCRDYPAYCILKENHGRLAGHHGRAGSAYCSEAELLLHHAPEGGYLYTLQLILAGAGVAFCLNYFEHLVISRTSALTLNAASLVKLSFLFIATNLVLGESISLREGGGLAVSMSGVLLYNYNSRKEAEERERAARALALGRAPAAPAKA